MTEIVTVRAGKLVLVDTPLGAESVLRGGRNRGVSSVFPANIKAGDRGVEPRVAVLEMAGLRGESLQRHAVKSRCDRQCDRHGLTASDRRLLRELLRVRVPGPLSPSRVAVLRWAWGADRRRP